MLIALTELCDGAARQYKSREQERRRAALEERRHPLLSRGEPAPKKDDFGRRARIRKVVGLCVREVTRFAKDFAKPAVLCASEEHRLEIEEYRRRLQRRVKEALCDWFFDEKESSFQWAKELMKTGRDSGGIIS